MIDLVILIITVALGFIGGFIDNSFGMGYGMLSPIFILFLDIAPIIAIPTLLISQVIIGFSGSIFHHKCKNANFKEFKSSDSKSFFLFLGTGLIGVIFAMIITIALSELFVVVYIAMMTLCMGIIVLNKRSFKGSWLKLCGIAGLAGFNKGLSGGGYGPLVTTGQIMSGRAVKSSVAATQLSECTISVFALTLYFLLNDFNQLLIAIQLAGVMIISGILSAPLGALMVKKLKDITAKKIVGFLSISIGVISLIRIFIPL